MDSRESYEITEYTVLYFGGGARRKQTYKYKAMIRLYDLAEHFANLFFHCSPGTLPESDSLERTKRRKLIQCHFEAHQFSEVLDLLRNEGPVYFYKLADLPTIGVLSTEKELVGEGELQRPLEEFPGAC